MKNDTPAILLKKRIAELEEKQKKEGTELKEQLLEAYENLKFVNIIRRNIRDIAESKELRDDSFKIIFNSIHNFISNLLNKAFRNSEENVLKTTIVSLLNNILSNILNKLAGLASNFIDNSLKQKENM